MVAFAYLDTVRPGSKFRLQSVISDLFQRHFGEIIQCRFMDTSVNTIRRLKGKRSIGCLHLGNAALEIYNAALALVKRNPALS